MKTLLVACLFLFAALPAAPARAADSLDECAGFIDVLPAVLSTPGTWCLRKDLSTAMATGNAITLASPDARVDCKGFKLGGLPAGAGTQATGIYAQSRARVGVRNCNLRGFFLGVSIVGTSPGARVEDNRFDGITFRPVFVNGVAATVRGNRVLDTGGSTVNGGARGMLVQGEDCVVSDNDLWGLQATPGENGGVYGISATGTGCKITGNRIRRLLPDGGSSATGILANSVRQVVEGNFIAGDGIGTGIQCAYASTVANGNSHAGLPAAAVGCTSFGEVHLP